MKRRWSVRRGCSLLVLLLCMAGHLYLVWHGTNALPQSVEVSGEEGIRLNAEQLEELENSGRYSFSMKHLMDVESILTEGDFEGKEFPDQRLVVEGWYTNSAYGNACHLQMVDGVYFEVNPTGEFSQTVVISDELAEQLYFRTDVAGETIRMDGKSYEICGVYKKDQSLPVRLSESRFDRVYLPYPAYPQADGIYPVLFFYDQLDGEALFSEKVTGELGDTVGTDLSILQTVDLKEYTQLIWQTFRLALFAVGVVLEAVLFRKIWIMLFERKEDSYIRRSAAQIEKQNIALRIGYFAGLLALMAVIGAVIVFPLVIPTQYLPDENIFQLSWYLEVLTQSRQSENSRMIYSMYQGIARRTLWMGVGFLAAEVMGIVQIALLWRGSGKPRK